MRRRRAAGPVARSISVITMRKKLYAYPVSKPCEHCGEGFMCVNSKQVADNRFCERHRTRNKSSIPVARPDLYKSRLVDTICVDCGAEWRHDKQWLAKGNSPRCRPCTTLERRRRLALRRDPANMIETNCAVCKKCIVRKRERIERAVQAVTCSIQCRTQAVVLGLIKRVRRKPRRPRARHDYGPGWSVSRRAALNRDRKTCQTFGM